MKIGTFVLLAACLCLPVLAGTPSERENEIRRMREKEMDRAKTAVESFSNKEDFAEKYEQLKESEPKLFADALEKRLLAAKAWQMAAEGFAKIENYDQFNAVKAPAYDAEAVAEIARMELKAAGAEKEWSNTAEKYKSREIKALAEQMIQNQRTIIQTTKQQMLSQRQLRQLDIERVQLSYKMRDMQDKAREEERDKKDKDSSKDRDKDHDKDREKNNSRNDKPGKPLVE